MRLVKLIVLGVAFNTLGLGNAVAITTVTEKAIGEVSFDWSVSIPIGMSWGFAWSPFPGFEIAGVFSLIEFKTNSPYDELESYGLMPNRGTFFSYGLGPRLVYSHKVDTPRGVKKERFFLGCIWRNFVGSGRTGDALDCLYCSDWSLTCEYPVNTYMMLGVHHGNTQISFEYRLSDERGLSVYTGSDPYGLGDSWHDEWAELGAPSWIIQIGHVWSFEY